MRKFNIKCLILLYHKILLIYPGRIYGKRTNLMSLYSGVEGGLYSGGKSPQFSIFQTYFSFFFQYKAHILAFFMLCKMWNMFKVNNLDTRIYKVNDEFKNKYTIDLVLAFLLLTLNTFHFLLQCFFYWLWSVNCWLGLFVVLMLCACWNQFGQSFH